MKLRNTFHLGNCRNSSFSLVNYWQLRGLVTDALANTLPQLTNLIWVAVKLDDLLTVPEHLKTIFIKYFQSEIDVLVN